MTGMAAATSPVVEPIDLNAAPASADPAATEATVDANAADPSPVDSSDANTPASLLDVVKAAVAKEPEQEASSTPEGDPVTPPAEEEAAAEPDAADDADLPFHNHPRWKQVIAERDSLKDPAEKYGLITGFMQEHGLSNEEVAEGYEVMALLKSGDPAKLTQARDWFASRLDVLDGMLGHSLPDDIQQKIDEGLLDEDSGLELAQARAAKTLLAQQATQRTEADKAAETQRGATAITTAMVSAVEAWEARTKATDPDYLKKADLVIAKSQAIVARTGTPPRTPEEATALADQALAEVNALFKSALPKPRAIVPPPAGQSTVATAQPQTLRAAIDAALGR